MLGQAHRRCEVCRFGRVCVVRTAALGVGCGISAVWSPPVLAAFPRYRRAARSCGRRGSLGQQWPPPGSNIPPPPGPVVTQRPIAHGVQVSSDGQNWTTVTTVTGRHAATDVVHSARRARGVDGHGLSETRRGRRREKSHVPGCSCAVVAPVLSVRRVRRCFRRGSGEVGVHREHRTADQCAAESRKFVRAGVDIRP